MRWSGELLRLCGHVLTRDDVIPTSCMVAAVAVSLQLVARCSSHLLIGGGGWSSVPLQLTGMAPAVDTLSSAVAASTDRPSSVDVAALDAWYRRHVTFEIANLAGALRHFADGKHHVQSPAWLSASALISINKVTTYWIQLVTNVRLIIPSPHTYFTSLKI